VTYRIRKKLWQAYFSIYIIVTSVQTTIYITPTLVSHTTEAILWDLHTLTHYIYWNMLGIFVSSSIGHHHLRVKVSPFFDVFCYFLELIEFSELTWKLFVGAGEAPTHPYRSICRGGLGSIRPLQIIFKSILQNQLISQK
jgi:hypothetical protein